MLESKLYNKLRQVKFLTNQHQENNSTNSAEKVSLLGRLQGWALRPDSNQNIVTVAIVEDQDGNIHEVEPVDLKFIDTEYHRIADE